MDNVKTASGYADGALDQALDASAWCGGGSGKFYCGHDAAVGGLLPKNRPEDGRFPFSGPGRGILSPAGFGWEGFVAGNIQAYPESDETFPRLKSQQRSVVQQLMASSDPLIQQALADPANIGFVKSVLGLSDLVVPGEDSRNKQLREIDLLLRSEPIATQVGQASACQPLNSVHDPGSTQTADRLKPVLLLPSVPVDLLFDNHVVELEECFYAGRIPMPVRSRASRIPRGSRMCALMRRRICGRLDWRMRRAVAQDRQRNRPAAMLVRIKSNNTHKNKHHTAKEARRHGSQNTPHPYVDVGHSWGEAIQQRATNK